MDDFATISIPLDREAQRRLLRFAKAIHEHPLVAAARLLSDLLADDEFYNAAEVETQPTIQ